MMTIDVGELIITGFVKQSKEQDIGHREMNLFSLDLFFSKFFVL